VWWFLRLAEPDHHLRLRVRLDSSQQFGNVAALLSGWARELADIGLVGDLQLDTYRPEVGRFGGGHALQAAEAVFAADSAATLTQLRLPASGTRAPADPAVTAASMLDLVTGLSPTERAGQQWLLDRAPRSLAAPPPREHRAQAVELAATGHQALAALPGGDDVLAAWARRRTTLTDYRAVLLEDGVDPATVLPDLLHLHHARVTGPNLDRERVCLHLARAAALSQRARAPRAGRAA
jgi:thiopeptide-type bacteriocin biosynthesis protein